MKQALHPTETPKSVSTPPQGGSSVVAQPSQNNRATSTLLVQGSSSATSSSPLEGEPKRAAPAYENIEKPLPRFGGGYNSRNTTHAKSMRKKMTAWEYCLWLRLKNKQLCGYKFRRQQPIGHYIVDFLNTEKKLVVELDGSQHVASEYDKKRDLYLMRQGYSVLRFWNTDVNANLEGVLTAILSVLESTPHQTTSHAACVVRISDAAWEVVWLPLKGGARYGAATAYSDDVVDVARSVEEV